MANLYIGNAVINIILGKYTHVNDISQIISYLSLMILNDDMQRVSHEVNNITIDAVLSRVMSGGNIIRIDITTNINKDDLSCVTESALLYNTTNCVMKLLK